MKLDGYSSNEILLILTIGSHSWYISIIIFPLNDDIESNNMREGERERVVERKRRGGESYRGRDQFQFGYCVSVK